MGSPARFERYHQHTIALSSPKTGQEIIDAVKLAVFEWLADHFILKYLRGKKPAVVVGAASKKVFKNFVILTWSNLDKTRIEPDAQYWEIAVGSNNWPGIIDEGLLYDQKVYVKEVEYFSSRVEEILTRVR